jgi:hypothetical protein
VVVELNIWCQMNRRRAQHRSDVLWRVGGGRPHLVVFGDDGRPLAVRGRPAAVGAARGADAAARLTTIACATNTDWLDAWT